MPAGIAPNAADWGVLADQATAVGVLVALSIGIATTVIMARQERLTRHGQRLQRELADAAAARAEAAARLTEEYTRRVVDALETLARQGTTIGVAPPPAGARWAVHHLSGRTYRLTNVGGEPARGVRVAAAHESLQVDGGSPRDLGPQEATDFQAGRTPATRDSTISVVWTAPDGEQRSWRYPLPD